MTLLKETFPVPGPTSITSYSFTDITQGIGIIDLLGAVHSEVGTKGYFLTTNSSLYSNNIVVSGAVGVSTTTTQVSNNTFSVLFQRPQNIRGYAHLSITLGGWKSGPTGTSSLYLSGASLAISGASSTTLATASGDLLQFTTTGNQSKTMNIQFNLNGQVYHVKRGDFLKLNLPLWTTSDTGDVLIYGGYGTDPANRASDITLTLSGTTPITKMTLSLPVIIP